MKARIKATGEIVYVTWNENKSVWMEVSNFSPKRLFQIYELENAEESPFDYETLRNETAAKVLLTLLNKQSINMRETIEAPMLSIELTDNLINRLKTPKE